MTKHRRLQWDQWVERCDDSATYGPTKLPDPEPLTLVPVLSGEFFKQLVAYPVIVECWDHAKHGRGRRAFEVEFDEDERSTLAGHYDTFRGWHLHRGLPRTVEIPLSDIPLLQRACNFFAVI